MEITKAVPEQKQTCRILLVGGTGRVGRLVSCGWNALPPENGVEILHQNRNRAHASSGDLLWDPLAGPEDLLSWIARTGPIDVMIVLAGIVPASRQDLSLNSDIAKACLEGAQAAGIRRVLMASSSAVYGAWKKEAFSEQDQPRPENHYGRAKLEMEAVCSTYEGPNLNICCLRIGNVAGADALLLNQATCTTENPLRIEQFSDGAGPVRSYIGPIMLSHVLMQLAIHKAVLPGVLNVAASTPVAMENLAQALRIPWVFVPALKTAIQRITLDCSELITLVPVVSRPGLADEIISELRKVVYDTS